MDLWHHCMGHIGKAATWKFLKSVKGITFSPGNTMSKCEPCIIAKHAWAPNPASTTAKFTVHNLACKDEVYKCLDHYQGQLETETGKKITRFCIEDGGELNSSKFIQSLKANSIERNVVPHYEHWKNSKMECFIPKPTVNYLCVWGNFKQNLALSPLNAFSWDIHLQAEDVTRTTCTLTAGGRNYAESIQSTKAHLEKLRANAESHWVAHAATERFVEEQAMLLVERAEMQPTVEEVEDENGDGHFTCLCCKGPFLDFPDCFEGNVAVMAASLNVQGYMQCNVEGLFETAFMSVQSNVFCNLSSAGYDMLVPPANHHKAMQRLDAAEWRKVEMKELEMLKMIGVYLEEVLPSMCLVPSQAAIWPETSQPHLVSTSAQGLEDLGFVCLEFDHTIFIFHCVWNTVMVHCLLAMHVNNGMAACTHTLFLSFIKLEIKKAFSAKDLGPLQCF
ncbi:hypothetical protein B0H34DRAFT_677703 [Crassisporium funariophilum]|nr:hypothetical protein B0H34DRAFT_677703 [Crassisporium funariophilum]